METLKKIQASEKKWIWIAVLILALYPLRHLPFGVEWWDTGYNYANFKYMDHMDTMWISGTFLGTVLGHFFTLLPFGDRMMGMNFYTGLTTSFLGVLFFLFLVKKVKLPLPVAFFGEFLAENLCWCPTALLYNYLTYILMGLGTVFLYCALTEQGKKENRYFILAGVCLGLNVYTRLPNLAQMGLILAPWAMGILEKKGFFKVIRETLFCLLGYVLGLLFGLLPVAGTIGVSNYVSGIRRLLQMPSEASDYTLYSMVYSQVMGYRLSFYWLKYLLLVCVPIVVLGIFLGKKHAAFRTVSVLLSIAGFAAVLRYYKQKQMLILDYHKTASCFQFSCFFLIFVLLSGLLIIFHPRFSMRDKLLSGLCILIAFITPLGSNNHLYSAVNNLFLAAPFGLYLLVRCLKVCREKQWWAPFTCFTLFLAVFFVQTTLFGMTYVFQEADGGKNLHTKVENNDILKGMRTSPERAEELEQLTKRIREEELGGRELLLYGWIPSLSYYLDMPFLFTPWPDLASYNRTVMQADLERLQTEIAEGTREKPVLLLGKQRAGELFAEALLQGDVSMLTDEKLRLILEFAVSYGYEIRYESEMFVLLTAD